MAGTVDWDTPLDGVHAKSISAYRRYHGAFAEDTSGAPISGNLPINFLKHHQFSEELQFSGHALQNALDWATGAYYLDSEDFNSGIVDNSSNVGGRGILFLTGDPASSKDESVFAHVNYKITSAIGLELGARYSHETKRYTFYLVKELNSWSAWCPRVCFRPISAITWPASRLRCQQETSACRGSILKWAYVLANGCIAGRT